MTARRIVALFAVAVLAFAVGSSAFRLPGRALRGAAADAPAPSSLDDLTEAQIDFMLENNMTLDDAQPMQAAAPMQTKGLVEGILDFGSAVWNGILCSRGSLGNCDDAASSLVESASNTAKELLTYDQYEDAFWAASSSCRSDYSSLPDDNRSTASSTSGCKAQCEDKWWCTNFTYYPSTEKCYLFSGLFSDSTANHKCDSSKGGIAGSWS